MQWELVITVVLIMVGMVAHAYRKEIAAFVKKPNHVSDDKYILAFLVILVLFLIFVGWYLTVPGESRSTGDPYADAHLEEYVTGSEADKTEIPPKIIFNYVHEFKKSVLDGRIKDARIGDREIVGETTDGGKYEAPKFDGVQEFLEVSRVPIGMPPASKTDVLSDAFQKFLAQSWWSSVVSWLLLFVVIGFVFYAFRGGRNFIHGKFSGFTQGWTRNRFGFGARQSSKQEAGKTVDPKGFRLERDVKTTLKDVGGVKKIREELERIIKFLKKPQKFTKTGGRLPKGVLLLGPPGVGKTSLARALAGEAGVPFFSMVGSEFVEMFVGVGAARVRDLFQEAWSQAPCIIFFDEFDAVARARASSPIHHSQEHEQTLNQLLHEMDGFDAKRGVVILAATNNPGALDQAVRRKGRFDSEIVVPRPDLDGRAEILDIHLRLNNVPLSKEVDENYRRRLMRRMPGSTGADIEAFINEAALIAGDNDQDTVTLANFEAAYTRTIFGIEYKRKMVKQEARLLQYHEGGHALVGDRLWLRDPENADPVRRVSIIGPADMLGTTLIIGEDDRYNRSRQQLLNLLSFAFGGRAAEIVMFGEGGATAGGEGDVRQATRVVKKIISSAALLFPRMPIAFGRERIIFGDDADGPVRNYGEAIKNRIDQGLSLLVAACFATAECMLREEESVLVRLADALNEKQQLEEAEFRAVVGEPAPGYWERVSAAIPAATEKIVQGFLKDPILISVLGDVMVGLPPSEE